MSIALHRANQRRTAQRALRTYQPKACRSDFARDKEASQNAFTFCLRAAGVVILLALLAVAVGIEP